ncbi:MAG: exosome complex RNA-binding protein Csl4 [Thaumarchaeota archaeon]|nr:exosome complex RNA-binding protein Csl4 [Nitrososphaerota archaeon]MCY3976102.1 exosome complex RNA-binding protein Csl4 [Nitrososphaerota archaeon]
MNVVCPGDKLSCIEEYESNDNNTFDDNNGIIRSTTIGTKCINKKDHTLKVKSISNISLPKMDDVVIGVVVSVVSSMIIVSIEYVNNNKVNSKIECVCSTRGTHKKTMALVDDVIALKILGYKNGTIHASINDPDAGVLFTRCKKCSGDVITIKDGIKCINCTWMDDRKISRNFGNTGFIKLS